jgi:hypothetical protein
VELRGEVDGEVGAEVGGEVGGGAGRWSWEVELGGGGGWDGMGWDGMCEVGADKGGTRVLV